MPPRRGQRALEASATTRFQDIPEDLAVRVFSYLDVEERCGNMPGGGAAAGSASQPRPANPPVLCRRPGAPARAKLTVHPSTTHAAIPWLPSCRCMVAQVCRRWRQLAEAPQLLRQLQVSAVGLPQLRGMCAWLLRRAASHVEKLEISYCTDEQEDEVVESGAVMAELAAAAALCGTTGQPLTHLVVGVECVPLSVGSWVLALRGTLRRLHLEISTEMRDDPDFQLSLATPLHGLTALEALSADNQYSGWLALEPHSLPPSLTALHLAPLGESSTIALEQVGNAALQYPTALAAIGWLLSNSAGVDSLVQQHQLACSACAFLSPNLDSPRPCLHGAALEPPSPAQPQPQPLPLRVF